MANTFDPSGANNMGAIKDRITRTLSEATRDMTPTETFANVGKAAAQAATGHTTFGDALNSMNAKRLQATQQMMQVLQSQEQIDLQKQAGQRAERGLDLQRDQFGLQQDQFGLQQKQFEAGEKRAVGEERRADERLGLEKDRLSLSREELTHRKLQDAAAQGDADAEAVVNTLQSLVPEDQRAVYASRLADLPYDVDKTNVVTAIGRIRRDLEAAGGIPDEGADIKDVAGLRKEFTSMSDDFVQVRDAYTRILTSAEKPSPAGDLSMIFNYMKMLDPGSTVREGEFATAANAAPMLERMGISFEKISTVWEGKMLTDNQRRDFIERAQGLFKGALGNQDRLAEGMRGVAERFKMRSDDVVMDFAGPLRYRAMDDEELTSAMESAKTKAEFDAIADEAERRALAGAQ